ncbi:hypothetical protein CRENBAI_026866 [Crenichthys baileyi]|uniref:Uncharacterized protein n=1 Tax=Crenichthys baileyi TaxID=28760 RepID=A0AAV9RP97_9TELE
MAHPTHYPSPRGNPKKKPPANPKGCHSAKGAKGATPLQNRDPKPTLQGSQGGKNQKSRAGPQNFPPKPAPQLTTLFLGPPRGMAKTANPEHTELSRRGLLDHAQFCLRLTPRGLLVLQPLDFGLTLNIPEDNGSFSSWPLPRVPRRAPHLATPVHPPQSPIYTSWNYYLQAGTEPSTVRLWL